MENASIQNSFTSQHFFRLPQLKSRLGVSGSSIWGWVKKGTFPAPIKLAENTTAWHISDIEAWENARISESKKIGDKKHV